MNIQWSFDFYHSAANAISVYQILVDTRSHRNKLWLRFKDLRLLPMIPRRFIRFRTEQKTRRRVGSQIGFRS